MHKYGYDDPNVLDVLLLALNAAGGVYLFVLATGALKRPPVPPETPPVENYLVVVVTVGTERVLPALRETVAQLQRLGLRYVVLSSNPLDMSNVMVVPRDQDGNKYRAVRWFVLNYARPDTWYIFLDDDSSPPTPSSSKTSPTTAPGDTWRATASWSPGRGAPPLYMPSTGSGTSTTSPASGSP